MTNIEKWNLIVNDYKQLYGSLEAKIQEKWEQYCSALFNYQKLFNEIDTQKHLAVGSGNTLIPDIILRINDKDIFDIELKQYNLIFNNSFETQLISYFNQTHLSVGMVVCHKIYLFYYEYETATINKIEIPFEKDNQDGITLVEILTKDYFSIEKIKNFVLNKIKHEQNVLAIKKILTPEFIKDSIRDKLLEIYPVEDVDKALQGFYYSNPITKTSEKNSPTLVPIKKPTSFANDIRLTLRNWLTTKSLNGEISSSRLQSDKGHIRFTTQDLDEHLPYHENLKGSWGHGHFYAYEIVVEKNKFKIQIALNNKNAPLSIRNTFDRIPKYTNLRPKKADWEWWTIFSTRPFVYGDETTPEEIFNALDLQFNEVRQKVKTLVERLKNYD